RGLAGRLARHLQQGTALLAVHGADPVRRAALLAAALFVCSSAFALDDATAASALDFANQQLATTAARLSPIASPSTTLANGSWATVANTDLTNWTQGFFPGANWYLYDLTGDPLAKARADQWTRALEAQKANTQTHDL